MKSILRITVLLMFCSGALHCPTVQAQEKRSEKNRFVSQKENGMIKQQPARHLFADSILARKPVATENVATEIEQENKAAATDTIISNGCNCCEKRKEYRQHKRIHQRKERGPHRKRRGHHKRRWR